MTAAAPNPQKLLILAAIGIGVYWFATRSRAATLAAQPNAGLPASQYRQNAVVSAVSGLVSQLLGTAGQAAGTYDGRAAVPWSPAATGANNPSAYVASSAVDGVAANIPNVSNFDAAAGAYASGDASAYWQ